jgi:hypothetical protein
MFHPSNFAVPTVLGTVRESKRAAGTSRSFLIVRIGSNTGGQRLAAHLASDIYFSNAVFTARPV